MAERAVSSQTVLVLHDHDICAKYMVRDIITGRGLVGMI